MSWYAESLLATRSHGWDRSCLRSKEGPLRPPKELNPRVAEGLSALIVRALSERASERPSAGELAQALEEAGSQQETELDRSLFISECEQYWSTWACPRQV
jgi:hypothetical protein